MSYSCVYPFHRILYCHATTGPLWSRISSTSNSSFHSHLPSCTRRPAFVRNLKPQLRCGQVNLQIPCASSAVAVVFETVSWIVTCRVLVLVLSVFSIMSTSFLDPRDMELTLFSSLLMPSLVPGSNTATSSSSA